MEKCDQSCLIIVANITETGNLPVLLSLPLIEMNQKLF